MSNALENFMEMPLEEHHMIAFNLEALELVTNAINMVPYLAMIPGVLVTVKVTLSAQSVISVERALLV